MRKALIAIVVAAGLFAVGAFAASFAVQSEDVASGADDVTACAELVDIDFDDPMPNGGGEYVVAGATVTFYQDDDGNDVRDGDPTTLCDGFNAQINLVLDDGTPPNANRESNSVTVSSGTAAVTFTSSLVEEIVQAAVVVDGQTLFANSLP